MRNLYRTLFYQLAIPKWFAFFQQHESDFMRCHCTCCLWFYETTQNFLLFLTFPFKTVSNINSCLPIIFFILHYVLRFIMPLDIIFLHHCNYLLSNQTLWLAIIFHHKVIFQPLFIKHSAFVSKVSLLDCFHFIRVYIFFSKFRMFSNYYFGSG